MDKSPLSKTLPLILLGSLLLAGLITVFTQANNYGITADEPLQDSYGHAVMEWYYTLGRDQSFLAFPQNTYMPEHGGIFDAVIAAVQHEFSPAEHWPVRRIVTGLAGLIGLIAIALCGYALGGYWVAFLAALALWLYPRYYGAIYNNPKDIPAAVTMIFVLWAVLLLMKQWEQKKHFIRNNVLLGFCIGLAASIRATALIWYLILGVIVLTWWLLRGRSVFQAQKVVYELSRQFIAASTIGLSSLLTMMILWPYIFLNPIVNLYRSVRVMSQYPWNGQVLFNGQWILATQLPKIYVPEWLAIASPPALVVFALLGLSIACVVCLKKRAIDPNVAVVILAFIVPLGAIVGLHSVVYDTLRQFLFLVPPMILLAVYGFVQVLSYLGHSKQKVWRWAAVGVAVATLASYGLVAAEMLRLSPFEYTYFSPVVGGLPGSLGKFDTDYWSSCSKQASEWLVQNYQDYTNSSTPSVEGLPEQSLIAPFLSTAFHENDAHPDFYIGSTRDQFAQMFPTYRVIHTIGVEGVPLCVIKVNPALRL